MKKSRFALIAVSLVTLLAACSSGEAPPLRIDSNMGKIGIDVQTITLIDRSPQQVVHTPAGNSFTPTIANAIKQWAGDHLQAVGASGQAYMVIKDASFTTQALPVEHGFNSWFERQQAFKYIGHAEVEIEANAQEGYGVAAAQASRAVSLPENAGALERQDAYDTLLKGLMTDLEKNFNAAIHDHMANFIITAPPADAPLSVAPMPVAPVSGSLSAPLSTLPPVNVQ
jgi:hypothetical protein